ncbi:hypothetical protein N8I74_18260 [Chitiniphilus purpureus]|uniref:Uncharacterized protein n=1 Tax=Chitiniphilus purpureus TaxID=2981137 RepID=A0ABY6DQ72_9NEIS|nr:hypothetical protein [Chitiniphilus sp. CD1]UXY15231.1 hypothetical protein N8I74_18260 [Chitiniphilus sp. CD1]
MARQAKALAVLALLPALMAQAFESGSTGADGAFNPSVNTVVDLPPSGILNYTTVNIPAGVTVKFKKNAANTPVVILASGDVTVAGVINLDGDKGADSGTAGDGSQGDDGLPGQGGPGGFDGGRGGKPYTGTSTADLIAKKLLYAGGAGLGPGAGMGGMLTYRPQYSDSLARAGGGGAGHGAAGQGNYRHRQSYSASYDRGGGEGGPAYGSDLLLPLIGGSGGGGATGGDSFPGSGGGGGGGAILLASSGTVSVTGGIYARGGASGSSNGTGLGATGGGGAGGAIRIVATRIAGNGQLQAGGGSRGSWSTAGTSEHYEEAGGNGAGGRIRLEGESITYNGTNSPAYKPGTPGPVFIANAPTLRITKVAGVAAPANPTGNADIVLPEDLQNPVTVEFETGGVPVGNTVMLTVTPAYGQRILAQSPALAGTLQNATASVQVSLPKGPSTLSATTTYTIVAALGDALARFANNERVEKIAVTAALGQAASGKVTLITVSGKAYEVPASVLGNLPAA